MSRLCSSSQDPHATISQKNGHHFFAISGFKRAIKRFENLLPIWDVFKKMADTLPRESRVVNTFLVDRDLLGQWRIPTTMLLGGESPVEVRDSAMFICRSIPGCQLVILEEQGHSATPSAPEFFAAKVVELARG
jgi:pimeloyl-ACP methyl ester carboxylesterase